MKRLIAGVLILATFLSGCASSLESIRSQYGNRVDPISIKDNSQYQKDYEECCVIAASVQDSAQREAVARGIFGALLGAAVGAATGSLLGAGNNTTRIAGASAIYGGVAGAGTTVNPAGAAFCNCMINRGYAILY